jgi:trehalose 6-phosphate phosphatase
VTPDDALAWAAAVPGTTGIFSDFDGTLSAIVRVPEDARPVAGAVGALVRLAEQFAVVAVVSGRPVSFLVAQLGLKGPGRLHAYGLHGVEHSTGAEVDLAPGAADWRSAVAGVTTRRAELEAVGVSVEDKTHGVTLHWRRATDPAAAEAAAMAAVDGAAATGLIPRPGKASVELVPPVGVDKGTVVLDWVRREGLRRVVFLGDDVSDVLAFDAIDTAVAEAGLQGLKLGVAGHEAPSLLVERADILLASPEEAAGWLSQLASRLER